MSVSYLITRPRSFVLTIDMQQKLAPAIDNIEELTRRNDWLLAVAGELKVPIIFTEQYPQGLGTTVEPLRKHFAYAQCADKLHFSALQEEHIVHSIEALGRPQAVLCGMEAHVCVLQTALDLLAAGYQVFIVEDAVGSREPRNKELALTRLRQAGCVIVSAEMVVFEWLHRCATDEFRHISKAYIR